MKDIDLIGRLRRVDTVLTEVRAAIVASLPAVEANGHDPGADFAPHNLIDPASGRMRFGVAEDTLRKWARETQDTAEAIGRLRGHRWELSIPRLRKRCGLG